MRKYKDTLAGMERKTAARTLLGLILVWHAPLLFALGLGQMRVQSALDQPMRAEIELTGVQEPDLRSLEVTLASKAEFAKAGVTRADHLLQLKFEIARGAGGRQVVQVSSRKAIKEPFLQFVIAAQWSGGRVVREYTALLDPPLYASDKPAPVSTPKVVADEAKAAVPAATKPAKPVKPIIGGPVSEPGAVAKEPAGTAVIPPGMPVGRSAEYGPVETGDTLWHIASQLDPGGAEVNIFQILIALHRENPDAFIGGSIHRLKKGAILKLGNTESIAAVSKKEASRFYQAQLDEWLAYKGTIAKSSTVTMIPETQAVAKTAPDTGRTAKVRPAGTAAPPEQASADKTPGKPEAAAPAKEPAAELRIVQAPAGAEAGKDKKAADTAAAVAAGLRNQISTLEESLASRDRENRELRERVALLETQIKNATRLVQIESQQLAQSQPLSQPAAKAPVAGAVTPTPEPGAGAKPAETTAAAAPAPEKPASAEPAKPVAETKTIEAPKPAEPPIKAAEAPKPSVVTAEKPAAEKPVERKTRVEAPIPAAPGLLDNVFGFLSDSLTGWTLGGLGVVVAGLGGLMYYRRRRSLAEFQESVLMTGHGQTTTTASEPNQNTRTDTSFLSDFGLGGVNVQADEVDPLAEAEVYLAYGRDEQAEEVLRDAAARNPKRLELKTKLLEIYKQRKDVKSFETLAEELYPASGKGDPEVWKKVAAMGHELNPENPLFVMEIPVDAFERRELFSQPSAERAAPAKAPAAPVTRKVAATAPAKAALDVVLPAMTAAPVAAADEITLAAPQADDLDLGLDSFDKPDDTDLLDLEWETEKPAAKAAKPAPAQALEEFSLELPGTDETAPTPAIEKRPQGLESPLAFDEPAPKPALDASLEMDADWPAEPAIGFAAEKTAEPDWALHAIPDTAPAARAVISEAAPPAAPEPEDQLAWDEAATKLELARAYMDMGDKVGARSILDEVVKEGNPAQQQQAKDLFAQLSA